MPNTDSHISIISAAHLYGVKLGSSIDIGGTLDFFGSHASIKKLFSDKDYTREKFCFQLSNHFPLWVKISDEKQWRDKIHFDHQPQFVFRNATDFHKPDIDEMPGTIDYRAADALTGIQAAMIYGQPAYRAGRQIERLVEG